MKTKYFNCRISPRLFFWTMVLIILLTAILALSTEKVRADSWLSGYTNFPRPAGDCFSDQAEGDFYLHNYCWEKPEKIVVEKVRKVRSTSDDSTNSTNPTVNSGETPTQTPDGTPGETTPEKTCKNKNQWKDGTKDCNAGGGNN